MTLIPEYCRCEVDVVKMLNADGVEIIVGKFIYERFHENV